MRSGQQQRQFARLREFKKQGGRCIWCDCLCILPEQLPFELPNNTGRFPPWLATLEHLYDRHHPERLNANNNAGRRVMACRQCNQARGVRTHKAWIRETRGYRIVLDDPLHRAHTAPTNANAIPGPT